MLIVETVGMKIYVFVFVYIGVRIVHVCVVGIVHVSNFRNKCYNNTSLAAPGALAHRLQRRTACKIQNGRQGAPKWPTGSGKGSNPRLLAISSHFRKIIFLIQALLL